MRSSLTLLAVAFVFAPSSALASTFSGGPALWRLQEPTEGDGEEPMFKPTSSKAPDSAERAETTAAPSEPDPPSDTQGEDTTLEQERGKAKSTDFNRHGVGVRGGITVIPTWILSRYLDSHTNSLCRGESIGNFAEQRGLLKTDGCNFYVGGEYIYRQSRILDIVASVGYHRMHTPDGYWLDAGESISSADYTEVNLDMMFMQADFIARYPIVVNETVEFGLGGGAGIGLGVLFGGVYQTPLGGMPARGFTPDGGPTDTCNQISDLADMRRCTPRWDAGEAQDAGVLDDMPSPNDLSNPNDDLFATCTADTCSAADLATFGYRRKQGDIPPVIPIINLIISARLIVKDVFAVTVSGGWNTGFYFGGGLAYMFGKQFQKTGRSGPSK
jgi:hypothetical protein